MPFYEVSVFSYFKDTIWNQFTTVSPSNSRFVAVCLVISKIQSGINSQHGGYNEFKTQECV